ncbi:hypothetical protein AB5I41_04230 [Sphingomonas sp. MMS24-JH45]
MLLAGLARADRGRCAERHRPRHRGGGAGAHPRLCRQVERLPDLDARRARAEGEQRRRLSRLGHRRLAGDGEATVPAK